MIKRRAKMVLTGALAIVVAVTMAWSLLFAMPENVYAERQSTEDENRQNEQQDGQQKQPAAIPADVGYDVESVLVCFDSDLSGKRINKILDDNDASMEDSVDQQILCLTTRRASTSITLIC